MPIIFKGSFDKANRQTHTSERGVGMDLGLRLLERVRTEFGLPVITDIHEVTQAEPVGAVVDIVQIPSLLCRQTDLIMAAGRTGRIVNVKRGQFAGPGAALLAAAKVHATGNPFTLLTDRGTTFGYGDIVLDIRNVPRMQRCERGSLVVQDVSHAAQSPSTGRSTGDRDMVSTMARAAVAAGCDGVFIETHPDPASAISDRDTQLTPDQLRELLLECRDIAMVSRGRKANRLAAAQAAAAAAAASASAASTTAAPAAAPSLSQYLSDSKEARALLDGEQVAEAEEAVAAATQVYMKASRTVRS